MSSSSSRVHGFALLEALVAILIFTVGVLGVIGLQATMNKAQGSAKFRADAAFLASSLIGTMWSDLPNLDQYQSSACSTYARCSQWSAAVSARLPGGASTVTVAAGVVTIEIRWAVPGEGAHRYITSSTIQV